MPSPPTHTYHLRATEQRQAHKQRIAQRVVTKLRIAKIKRLEREKQGIDRITEQMQIAEELRIEQQRNAIKDAENHLHTMLLEIYQRKKDIKAKGKQSKEERQENYTKQRKKVFEMFSSQVQYAKRKFLIS